MNFSNEIIQKV